MIECRPKVYVILVDFPRYRINQSLIKYHTPRAEHCLLYTNQRPRLACYTCPVLCIRDRSGYLALYSELGKSWYRRIAEFSQV